MLTSIVTKCRKQMQVPKMCAADLLWKYENICLTCGVALWPLSGGKDPLLYYF